MLENDYLQEIVHHALNHYSFTDAAFLAERVLASASSPDNLYLLAECYFKANDIYRVYSLFKQHGCSNAQSRYLMAQCCYKLRKFTESENYLTGNFMFRRDVSNFENIISEFGSSAAYALNLLAMIYRKTSRITKAIAAFKKSLSLNPFLWSSFESLCDMGETLDADATFKFPEKSLYYHREIPIIETKPVSPCTDETFFALSGNALSPLVSEQKNFLTTENIFNSCSTPAPATSVSASQIITRRQMAISSGSLVRNVSPIVPGFDLLSVNTPSPAPSDIETCTPSPIDIATTIHAPKKEKNTAKKIPASAAAQNVFSVSSINQDSNMVPPSGVGLRRSSRLNNITNLLKENSKSNSKPIPTNKSSVRRGRGRVPLSKLNRPCSPNNVSETLIEKDTVPDTKPFVDSLKVNQNVPSSDIVTTNARNNSMDVMLSVLRVMGKGYHSAAAYEANAAIAQLNSLPYCHFYTGWTQAQLGRAFLEAGRYKESVDAFKEMRRLEPHRMADLDYYSTALWHLRQEMELSALAQQLPLDVGRFSPQLWCVFGNCFSLQCDHETAIKFLQRAIQVEPDFAYAYTLLGHEYFQMEEVEKSLACYRNATRINPRHYNAWYGIGNIYNRQEKYQQAELHYKKALSIKKTSAVLLCHVAIVQHAQQKTASAFEILNEAIALAPNESLSKFHKASIYFSCERYDEALQILEELKRKDPKESLLYFLTAKIYKRQGCTHLALMNFSWALDLDPKGASSQIKDVIDKRFLPEEDDLFSSVDQILGPELGSETQDIEAVESDLDM